MQAEPGHTSPYTSSAAPAYIPNGQGEFVRRDSKGEGFFKEMKGSMKHLVQKCKGKKSQSKEGAKPAAPMQPAPQPQPADPQAPQPQATQPPVPQAAAPQGQTPQMPAPQQASPSQQPAISGQTQPPPQPPLPQSEPTMPQPGQHSPQGPQLQPPNSMAAATNEFKYPHCRIDQPSPHYRSSSSHDVSHLEEDMGPSGRDWDPPSRREHHESARSYHESVKGHRDTGRDNDWESHGSLEERYRRFLSRTGRANSLNYPEEDYDEYADQDYYSELYRRNGNRDMHSYSDMDYQGLPRPPVPPTRIPRPDHSSWNPQHQGNMYMPAGGLGYGDAVHAHNEAAFMPPIESPYMPTVPAPYLPMPEMAYFANDYAYTSATPMSMGTNLYAGGAIPNMQNTTFWGAASDALPQSYNHSLQPASDPKVAGWSSNDLSLLMPYNSTRPGYPDVTSSAPMLSNNVDHYAASIQRRLSIPMVV